jgi:peptidyl-prolyl cis-trans isomerase C
VPRPGSPTAAALAALLAAAGFAVSCAAAPPPPPPLSSPGAGAPDGRPALDLAGAPPGPPEDGGASPAGALPAGEDPAVAIVDGLPVKASEVARFLFRFDPPAALRALEEVVNGRIVEADAAAAGITVPEEDVIARVEEQVRERQTEIRVQYGPSATLDAYLRESYGTDIASFRRDLAVLARRQALAERLVRWEGTREERIRIRLLVLPDEPAAREAAARLRDGADFAALARQVSLAPAEELPPFRRADVHPPALAEELFSLAPGEVSRPVRVAREDRELFQVFKVIERTPASTAPWGETAAALERGLRERPVGRAEYLQWARGARERHGVRSLLEPPVPPAAPAAPPEKSETPR